MAFELLSDSSEYQDDFEESYESTEMTYDQTNNFPNLFENLENALSGDNSFNLSTTRVDIEKAVGVFLAKVKESRDDIVGKIK